MLFISSLLELIGILSVGVPTIKLALAKRRVLKLRKLVTTNETLYQSLARSEHELAAWPEGWEMPVIILGWMLSVIGLGLKTLYYAH